MTANENAAVVRSGYEAFARGDLATVTSLFSPDIVWHIPGSSPLAGDRRGPADVVAFFGDLAAMSGGTFSLQLHDLLASDDHVVALGHQTAQRNGKTLDEDLVHVWHVSDGKATEFWGVPYDAAAADAFWA